MEVITKNQILVIGAGDTSDADIFLPADGADSIKRAAGDTTSKKAPKAKDGSGAEKLKTGASKVYKEAKELGFVDLLLGKIGLGAQPQGGGQYYPPSNTPENKTPEKKAMSTTNIVLIGVGTVLVVGLIIYAANRNKGK